MALSQSLMDIILLVKLYREIKESVKFETFYQTVHHTLFEDDKGYIELIETPRISPRTKHIVMKHPSEI